MLGAGLDEHSPSLSVSLGLPVYHLTLSCQLRFEGDLHSKDQRHNAHGLQQIHEVEPVLGLWMAVAKIFRSGCERCQCAATTTTLL